MHKTSVNAKKIRRKRCERRYDDGEKGHEHGWRYGVLGWDNLCFFPTGNMDIAARVAASGHRGVFLPVWKRPKCLRCIGRP